MRTFYRFGSFFEMDLVPSWAFVPSSLEFGSQPYACSHHPSRWCSHTLLSFSRYWSSLLAKLVSSKEQQIRAWSLVEFSQNFLATEMMLAAGFQNWVFACSQLFEESKRQELFLLHRLESRSLMGWLAQSFELSQVFEVLAQAIWQPRLELLGILSDHSRMLSDRLGCNNPMNLKAPQGSAQALFQPHAWSDVSQSGLLLPLMP